MAAALAIRLLNQPEWVEALAPTTHIVRCEFLTQRLTLVRAYVPRTKRGCEHVCTRMGCEPCAHTLEVLTVGAASS